MSLGAGVGCQTWALLGPRIMTFAFCLASYHVNAFGGIERSISASARGLVALGHKVVIITATWEGAKDPTGHDDISVRSLAHLRIPMPATEAELVAAIAAGGAPLADEFYRLINDINPYALIVADPIWGVAPLVGPRPTSLLPVCLAVHFAHPPTVFRHAIKQLRPDLLLPVSAALEQQLAVVLPDCSATSFVVPNSIVLSDFHDARPPTTPDILVPARISPEKGTLDAIAAFARVKDEYPGRLIICAGDFPFGRAHDYLASVREQIARATLDERVVLLPPLPWAEIPLLFIRAAQVLLPSHQETFGLAALEAMAAGRPIVATTAGNLPTLLKDVGWLVPPASPALLAEMILKVHAADACVADKVESGLKRAREFDAVSIAQRLVTAIGRLQLL